MPSEATEPNLLPLVAGGDQDAVRACLDRYGALVWSLARRMCRSSADAEDAVQDIFISVWKNADRFDAERGSEVTFIATIARRRLIDRVRRIGRRPVETTIDTGMPTPDMGPSVEAPAALSDEVNIARAAMAELNEEQRRVLQMSIGHGLSHERIAEATGIPLGTVKTHIRRGLIRVRGLIEEQRAQQSTGRAEGPGRTDGEGLGHQEDGRGAGRVRGANA
jgi:RNA polymerase sigma-70 factor, ECF subfamily